MKNIIRTVTLLSVISAMAISMTACTPKSAPMEVVETTVMTEQVTTPEETTIPEETTAPETTAPMEERVEKVYSNGIYCERYYDANGEVRKMDIYKEDGVSIDRVYERASGDNWYFTKYNENGKVIRMTKYSPDGVMMEYSLFKYDKNGNQTEVKTYTPDGKLV